MLTHVDQKKLPTMVDVSEKKHTARMALAETLVQLPEEFRAYLKDQEIMVKKGPVFQTAIVAGTMAVKKTHEMIPFCHQLPIESCKFEIDINEQLLVTIRCRVKTTYKTGVEMEAIHGAMTAALTVFDMCKAVSSSIVIGHTQLLAKTGGKKTKLEKPLYGLILTGGKSERMGEPKALINYHGKPQAEHMVDILNNCCDKVFLSAQKDQWKGTAIEKYSVIEDEVSHAGPVGGILSAFHQFPEVNWVVVACDLPHFNHETLNVLLANFDESKVAVAFKNKDKDFPEALCAIYSPHAKVILEDAFKSGVKCPVKILSQVQIEKIDQDENVNLTNVNTKEEYLAIH